MYVSSKPHEEMKKVPIFLTNESDFFNFEYPPSLCLRSFIKGMIWATGDAIFVGYGGVRIKAHASSLNSFFADRQMLANGYGLGNGCR